MEKVIRNVRDLKEVDRLALEQVIGEVLREDQQVIIDVVNDASAPLTVQQSSTNGNGVKERVPDWWNVYEGLSDEEIDRLDAAVRQRANLTRTFE